MASAAAVCQTLPGQGPKGQLGVGFGRCNASEITKYRRRSIIRNTEVLG